MDLKSMMTRYSSLAVSSKTHRGNENIDVFLKLFIFHFEYSTVRKIRTSHNVH